jgi:hypothetical protein
MASSSSKMVSYSIQGTIAPWFHQAQGWYVNQFQRALVPNMALSSSKTGSHTSAQTMASSSSRMVSYSVQRTIVPTKASSCSKSGSSTISSNRGLHLVQKPYKILSSKKSVIVPRKCALFFHRLSILERDTDHECINNCSYSKRNVGRIQVQRPCEFFLREEVFQI